ncbi:MAG: lipopolysaccharide kinase InaA family protein [Sedimentisphaerales bacterium]|jgi:RIO-like serine/threonine protein kinase
MTEFFIDPAYKTGFERLGLASIEAVFAFGAGKNLTKENLASYRSRIEFQIYLPGRIESPAATVFLKRYDNPPIMTQLKNWLSAKKRVSCALAEVEAAQKLAAMGINTPQMTAWGQLWGSFFEKRSFAAIEEIREGQSLERSLPGFFNGEATKENLVLRRQFIRQLASFIRKFHDTGYRHRDLYLCHIFRVPDGRFYLIDLARAFKPMLLGGQYRVKDIAQLHYSAPAKYFSKTDRLRFLRAYLGREKLSAGDKSFARRITSKAKRMARHDTKHGRVVPFAT